MEATETLVEGLGYFLCCAEDARDFEPCPFCGGGYQEIYEAGVNWMTTPMTCRYTVVCDCGARLDGGVSVYSDETRAVKIVEGARGDWNRRAQA